MPLAAGQALLGRLEENLHVDRQPAAQALQRVPAPGAMAVWASWPHMAGAGVLRAVRGGLLVGDGQRARCRPAGRPGRVGRHAEFRPARRYG